MPLSIRRELLERELKQFGLRKARAQGGASPQQPPQQPQGHHPQADSDRDTHSD